jgi:6-phosphofructokinase 1
MEATKPEETAVATLGQAKVDNPLDAGKFVPDAGGVQVFINGHETPGIDPDVLFEEAGPREKLYFDPSKTKCAVVTCGGLCPGINDVVQSIVMTAHYNYGVSSVVGIRYGLEGFIPKYQHDLMELSPGTVSRIHEFGGTVLGSSRGPQSAEEIVDALERMNISILFMIGGDGTMRAARKVVEEVKARKARISIIGVPKTIDNDIHFVASSFGFDTAVAKATESIRCAHAEATGAPNGIGVVKLMGRESGFIAAQATLALKEVNFVLVPEDDFDLHGEHGLLQAVHERIANRGHAVIVIAEGAGQHLLETSAKTDASGNRVLGDVASMVNSEIKKSFSEAGIPLVLKFIDPSYIIRSVPANSNDRVYCGFLGQSAVHAGLAGKTSMVVSKWNGLYVHIPLDLVTRKRKHIDLNSNFWRAVLESTGQPRKMRAAR